MKIDIFEPISFCFGVENSIKMIKSAAISYSDKRIFCLGQPIHNEIVTKELENIGICVISAKPSEYESVVEALPNDCVLIFSAHGHDQKLEDICVQKNIRIIDTICPIVKRIRTEILSDISKGNEILYIGKNNHPESYAIVKISPLVKFWDISSSFPVDFQSNYSTVYNQTTILEDRLTPIYDEILKQKPNLNIKKTSCSFVNDRYEKLKSTINNEYDYVLIVGSKQSSNTIELYEKALQIHGNKKALLISKAEDLDFLNKLDVKPQKIAIFSGTSAPSNLINEIYEILKQL